jgi:hypothetical protein
LVLRIERRLRRFKLGGALGKYDPQNHCAHEQNGGEHDHNYEKHA